MKIIKITAENIISEAIKVLESGGIVIYPTETAYGVGVDATNSDAVEKLLQYKNRIEGKAISVAVVDEQMADEYVELNDTAKSLYANFLPGPLTVISKSKHKVDTRLESENGNLGIRIPDYELILDILKEFKRPITATSANSSGKKTPYSVEDVLNNVSEKQKKLIDLVINAGELPKRQTSSVVDTTTSELRTYRQGRLRVGIGRDKACLVPTKRLDGSKTLKTHSVEDTIQLGYSLMQEKLIDLTQQPVIILLSGELGAGKTHLTKGIAKALGIERTIKSPTYNYVDEHSFKVKTKKSKVKNQKINRETVQGKLYHFDAWRLQSKEDLEALRFSEWLRPENVIVVEWPDILLNIDENILKTNEVINVDIVENQDEREIYIS